MNEMRFYSAFDNYSRLRVLASLPSLFRFLLPLDKFDLFVFVSGRSEAPIWFVNPDVWNVDVKFFRVKTS